MKQVLLLGSTGSVGRSVLDVVSELPERFEICGLAAGLRWEELAEQALEHRVPRVAIADVRHLRALRERLPQVEVFSGPNAALELLRASSAEVVVGAIVGSAGLPTSWEAIDRGMTLALANKESLVMAGGPLMKRAGETGARVVPIDSEHSAVFQAIGASSVSEVRRIHLTASGGPFWERSADELAQCDPVDALKHPTWSMGAKISVDSATMMNKGLEVIEARWLFDLRPDQIEVLVHRQSIVHSMVEFIDGSIVAQLGVPSMRIPILVALAHPERFASSHQAFDLTRFAKLTFEPADTARFPCLRLGVEVARLGGTFGAVLNAANEVAVESFLAREISFTQIPELIERTLERHRPSFDPDLAAIGEADRWARGEISRCLVGRS